MDGLNAYTYEITPPTIMIEDVLPDNNEIIPSIIHSVPAVRPKIHTILSRFLVGSFFGLFAIYFSFI
jgi:hypothetical protein